MYGDLDRPPLRARSLSASLVRAGGLWREVLVLAEAASTNAEVARAARAGAAEGLVVVAEHQSAGRGRQGRSWDSPPRAGLTVSVLLRPDVRDHAEWGWLPLLTGLAVVTALARHAGLDGVTLKWPNDVLAGAPPAKLAGVLSEVAAPGAAVVGLGLNVTTTAAELPPGATSLLLQGAATTDRDTVLRAVLRELETRYEQWHTDPAGLRADYTAACGTLGRPVRLELPGGDAVEGVATAVDRTGGLVVGDRTHTAADVIHLR